MKKTNHMNKPQLFIVFFVLCLCCNQLVRATMLSEEEIQSVNELQDQYQEKKDLYESQQLTLTKLNGELSSGKALLEQLKKDQQNAKESYHSLQKLDIEHPEYALAEQLSVKSAAYREASNKTLEKQTEIAQKENQLLVQKANLQRVKAEFDASKSKCDSYIQALATRHTIQKLHSLQKSVMVKTNATAVCGDDVTPRNCRKQALAKAERKALEQGSVIFVESVTEVKNFQLSYDEVQMEFKAQLSNRKMLVDTAGVGQHTIEITTEVTPVMTAALKDSINASASLEFQYQLRQAVKNIVYMPSLANETRPPIESRTRQQVSKLQPTYVHEAEAANPIKKTPSTEAGNKHSNSVAKERDQESASSVAHEKRATKPMAFPNF